MCNLKDYLSPLLSEKQSPDSDNSELYVDQNSSEPNADTGEENGIQISNEEFFKATFQILPEGASPAVCPKPGDPQEGGWPTKAIENLSPDQNNYLNCSSFYQAEDGSFNVKNDNFAAYHFLLLDDVGTKVPLERLAGFEPSWLIETSPGNYQAGILLSEPITDIETASRLVKALIDAGLSDSGASGVSRWARLPNGINGKPKHRDESGKPFSCKLTQWHPKKRYTQQEIIDGLKLNVADEPTPKVKSTAIETKSNTNSPVEKKHSARSDSSETVTKLKKLLGYLDPDAEYPKWCPVLMVIFNETKGSDEGLSLANTWSSKGKKYKGLAEIKRKWKSFNSNQNNPVTIATLCKMIKDNGGNLKAILGTNDGSMFECLDHETIVLDGHSVAADDHTDKPNSVDQAVTDTSSPTSAPPIDDVVIAELAAINPIEYDRVRVEKAKELGVQLKTLDASVKKARKKEPEDDNSPFDKIEPWPEPVDPTELLNDISANIRRYVVLDPEQANAAALLTVQTYLADVFNTCPLGIINAPEKECGKTVLLKLIERMCYCPLSAANITASALFRSVNLWHPTLLFDEADTFLRDNKELHGMINAGYERGGFVIRSESVGDTFIPRKFSVYCPKFIAGIALDRHLPDASMSRGIVFNMRRKRPGEKVERLRNADTAGFDVIKFKLTRFAQDYAERLKHARPVLPDELSDRDQDKWEPLLVIAECAGDEWFKRATEASLKLSNTGDITLCKGAELLSDMQYIFDSGEHPRKISTADLIKALCKDDEAPWISYNYGKPISPRQLANLLKPYGIRSKTVRQEHGHTPKGYDAEQFQDAFGRYIPAKKK